MADGRWMLRDWWDARSALYWCTLSTEGFVSYSVTSKYGIQFLGNSSPSTMEGQPQRETRDRQIDGTLRAGNWVRALHKTHVQAKSEGYDNCELCVGGSMP